LHSVVVGLLLSLKAGDGGGKKDQPKGGGCGLCSLGERKAAAGARMQRLYPPCVADLALLLESLFSQTPPPSYMCCICFSTSPDGCN